MISRPGFRVHVVTLLSLVQLFISTAQAVLLIFVCNSDTVPMSGIISLVESLTVLICFNSLGGGGLNYCVSFADCCTEAHVRAHFHMAVILVGSRERRWMGALFEA